MKVLVACEESQTVCKAFRKRGHEAYSCDIMECSGGHSEWHIKGDCLPLLHPKWYDLNRDSEGNQWEGYKFKTVDGKTHQFEGKWDLIIAFPPCTHLCVSGARHFEKKRADGRQREGIEFFCKFLNADCEKIIIENPIGIISGKYIKEHFPDLAEKYGIKTFSSSALRFSSANVAARAGEYGKIIGAVTHVLVQDSTRGYGIFIENMLEH